MGLWESPPPFRQTGRVGSFTPRQFVRRTVMMVDDDPAVLGVCAIFLRQVGHTVVEASDALEAQRAALAHPNIDVLITDYTMPGADGVELAEWFRRMSPRTQIAIVSGTDDALSRGAAHGLPVFQKPIPLWVLARLVEQLGSAELQQQAAAQQ